jgi:hypothetical protein
MRSFLQMSELYLKRLQRFAFHLCFLSLILMILSADHTRCFAKRFIIFNGISQTMYLTRRRGALFAS